MSDSVIQRAAEKRAAALAEARRWEEFIRMYSELGEGKAQDAGRPVAERTTSPEVPARAPSGALAETEAAVVAIVTELGAPVHTRDLIELLEERGIKIGGKDPVSTLSARLSRAPKLSNIRGKGWWMREEATGDADPEQVSSPVEDQPHSTPVEPGEEMAHEKNVDDGLRDLLVP